MNYCINTITKEIIVSPHSRNYIRKHALAYSHTPYRYWKFYSSGFFAFDKDNTPIWYAKGD